jgi:2-polyprenyl-3-methyl-5-hydroxy-6-metoxy-1,4-benzoquinol methylase
MLDVLSLTADRRHSVSKLQPLPLTNQKLASRNAGTRGLYYSKDKANGAAPLRILEAGCGQKWDLNLEGTHYVLTGVDLDETALGIRKDVVKDLHEIIVGDLRTVRLAESTYGVIFCSYVLEHITGAEDVSGNFVKWLKPDGMMIIQIPDPYSVKGFVTRMTPHWFHIFYRHVRGCKNAGKPGHAPYPTHYDAVVSREGMREFCQRNNLAIKAEFGCGWRTHGHGVTRIAIEVIQRLISVLSFGTLSSRHDDITYIVHREPPA